MFVKNDIIQLPALTELLGISSIDYRVVNVFKGGMGTCAQIMSGNENGNNSLFALKVIHPHLISDKSAYNRYEVELKNWLSISNCEGVADAICITKLNSIPCAIATWMPKGNLRENINRLTAVEIYTNIDRLLVTLDWTFKHFKIIHRDLKPENILLDKEGLAYITDWGISKIISDELPKTINVDSIGNYVNLTQVGAFIGSVTYASPEQLKGEKDIDERSDIYSIGCMLYELETGKPPFLGRTVNEIGSKHLYEAPLKLGGFLKRTNLGLERIINKCLKKNPNERYQNYKELISDYRKVASKRMEFNYFQINASPNSLMGKNQLEEKFKNRELKGLYSDSGKVVLMEFSEVKPYLEEAESLLTLNQYEKAFKIYSKFYKIETFVPGINETDFVQPITIGLALCLKNMNRIDEAINVLEAFDNAEKPPLVYYLNLSDIHLINKDYEKSLKLLLSGYKEYSNSPELLGNLSTTYVCLGKNDKALKYSERRMTMQINVQSLEEYGFINIHIAEELKDREFEEAHRYYRKAQESFTKAVELNPNFETAKLNLSNILFKQRKYNQSSKLAVAICNETENQAIVLIGVFYFARNLLWSGSFKEAIEMCEKYLKRDPSNVLLQRIRAEAICDGYCIGYQDKNGNRIIEESCLNFFIRIIRDEKNRITTDYDFLASLYDWMGDNESIHKALALLKEASILYPKYWKFNYIASRIQLKYGYPEDALLEAKLALTKGGSRENLHFHTSKVFRELEDLDNAKIHNDLGRHLEMVKDKIYNKE